MNKKRKEKNDQNLQLCPKLFVPFVVLDFEIF